MREERNTIRVESKLSWSFIAGAFDAFGGIHRDKDGRHVLIFTKTSKAVLERIRDFISPEANIVSDAIILIGHKRVYRLKICNYHDIIRVAKGMLPHSIVKRPHLSDALWAMKRRGYHYKQRVKQRKWTEEEKLILLLTLDEPRAEVARRLNRPIGSIDMARVRIKREG